MSFSATARVVFRETMSGTLHDGATDPDQLDDGPSAVKRRFKFTLEVDTGPLQAFLNAPVHRAGVKGGGVIWEGRVPDGTPIAAGGSIVMYRNHTPDGKHKRFDFLFSFKGPDGTWYSVSGEKRLSDDRGFDAAADLSRLFVTITADGAPVAAGITTVKVGELLDQVVSLEVEGETGAIDAGKAKHAFFTFMNRQIHQVYPSMPLLFQADEDRYLSPHEWRALTLITRLMLPDPLPANGPTIEDVILNLQNFIRRSPRSALDSIRTALGWGGLVAPLLSGLASELRKILKKAADDPDGAPPAFIDLLQRVAVMPYYSHPKCDPLLGYQRPRFRPKLQTRIPVAAEPSDREFDVVIVGAGIAGSILADRLTAAGRSVLLLESGPYLPEHEITTDEGAMTASLYQGAGLQSANSGGSAIAVLQARCVGGGGTINNAICFQVPQWRLDRWHDLGFPISTADFRAAYARVATELGIKPVSQATRFLNPAGPLLQSLGPIRIPDPTQPPEQGLFECLVNLDQCEGCGLCNTGCGFESKKNALQIHLVKAMATGRCELVPEAEVISVQLVRGPGALKASALEVKLKTGNRTVRGKEIILSAGAVASSALLLRSADVKRELPHLPIGKRFSANIGCPTFAYLGRKIHARPSLQISHYYMPEPNTGFVIENWFAPPGSLAVALPGFFDEHHARMRRYAEGVVFAPLVGSEPAGTITVGNGGKAEIALPVGATDLGRLRDGVATIAEAIIDSSNGAVPDIVAGTRRGFLMTSRADVQKFRASVTTPEQLRLGTGHPQGGNAISSDAAISVVDEQFRLRGVDNLRVCDASLFPEVAGVNPQCTVMALVDHCGTVMAGGS
jgi:choline dehydrogenase-like flavoprotein